MLALMGPTGAGKSALAHAAARTLGGEIVVADPFQRYRGLEVAADAPGPRARREVPYHFVGDLDLAESSSAGAFAPAAHGTVDAIAARGAVPIVAGGTGLYVRAAVADVRFGPRVADDVRHTAENLVAGDPAAARARLHALDPEAAHAVAVENPRRLARALELALAGVRSHSGGRDLWDGTTRRPTLMVAVVRPLPVLDALIAERVRRELADGLVAEIEAALEHPAGLSREAAQIIGVAEARALRSGGLDLAGLEDALAARTRRLARRQMTWLRKTPGVRLLDLGDARAEGALGRLIALWNERPAAVE